MAPSPLGLVWWRAYRQGKSSVGKVGIVQPIIGAMCCQGHEWLYAANVNFTTTTQVKVRLLFSLAPTPATENKIKEIDM